MGERKTPVGHSPNLDTHSCAHPSARTTCTDCSEKWTRLSGQVRQPVDKAGNCAGSKGWPCPSGEVDIDGNADAALWSTFPDKIVQAWIRSRKRRSSSSEREERMRGSHGKPSAWSRSTARYSPFTNPGARRASSLAMRVNGAQRRASSWAAAGGRCVDAAKDLLPGEAQLVWRERLGESASSRRCPARHDEGPAEQDGAMCR